MHSGLRTEERSEHDMMQAIGHVSAVNAALEAEDMLIAAGGLSPLDEALVMKAGTKPAPVSAELRPRVESTMTGFWVIRADTSELAQLWAQRCADACGETLLLRALPGS